MELTSVVVAFTLAERTSGPGEPQQDAVTPQAIRRRVEDALSNAYEFVEVGEVLVGEVGTVATRTEGPIALLDEKVPVRLHGADDLTSPADVTPQDVIEDFEASLGEIIGRVGRN